MRWSDGDSFDADDIMFWYQDVMLNEELTPRPPRRWALGGSFVQVEKVDDHTVTLNFAAPFPNWAPSMATTMGGDMLLPRHYLEGFHPDYTDRGEAGGARQGGGLRSRGPSTSARPGNPGPPSCPATTPSCPPSCRSI